MTEELLNSWVNAVNHILWDYLLIYGLIGIGLFFHALSGRAADYALWRGHEAGIWWAVSKTRRR